MSTFRDQLYIAAVQGLSVDSAQCTIESIVEGAVEITKATLAAYCAEFGHDNVPGVTANVDVCTRCGVGGLHRPDGVTR